jgi:amidase
LINKANFYNDPNFNDRKASLINTNSALTLATQSAMQNRFATQILVLQCFAEIDLDTVLYPSNTLPPKIMTNPSEPRTNDWGGSSTFPSNQGFPAITVPAGFTTHVFDRVADLSSPDGTRLVGPIEAKLPVGIEFLGRPFDEPMLFRIASAYEAATHHRVPPPAFGPLQGEP